MTALDRGRVLDLLGKVPAEPDFSAGYLDLEDAPAAASSLAQRSGTWTTIAPVYEHLWRPVAFGLAKGWPVGPDTEEEFALAREHLGLGGKGRVKPHSTVLDVACGPGNVTRALAAGVGRDGLVVGLDLSPGMLARAVRDTPQEHVAYVRGNAVDLPFADAAFDAVSCFGALYLFDDPWSVIDSMTRVLRPGGRVAILTSRRPRLPATGWLAARAAKVGGGYLFGHDEVVAGLRSRGFTNVRRRAYPAMQFVSARLG